MPANFKVILRVIAVSMSFSAPVFANSHLEQCQENWVAKDAASFAAHCAAMAFSDDLQDRETVAWMFFVRVNQLIKDSHGLSDPERVPQWMAWATDADTFKANPTFKFNKKNRDDLQPVTEKKLLAGNVSLTEPNAANEEVTRNQVAYDYLTKTAMLNTYDNVLTYVRAGNKVDMPVGSVEIKASWLKVPPSGAPDGALTFDFKSGTYWWRGMHIMAKMKSLPDTENLFYSEEPSWFWTTFEFTNNTGTAQVRENLITQRAPLSPDKIKSILSEGGIAGFGFEAYSPNGTQIRFTENGTGETPVILGHTNMEDFAGKPNNAQPRYWRHFDSSCHTCHATASINPNTGDYFPFTIPTGALAQQYYGTANDDSSLYLGDNFVSLDFMWPIAFQAPKPKPKPKDK